MIWFRRLFFAMILLLIASGMIAGLSRLQAQLNRLRQTYELTETAPMENAPPIVAFTTVALGGFRGLLADFLWLRALRLQDQGSYFEMVQLASWIVKLQPRFTGATAFLAWNMAYNISVTCNSYEDRWRWVQRGVELIRDEALIYNPSDPELFKELAWIYLHKMGQETDDANRYYKTQLALQMTAVLGEPPTDWQGLADAPRTFAEFEKKSGGDVPFETRLAQAGLTSADLETRFRLKSEMPAELAKTGFTDPELRQLELILRARWLRQRYKLDPVKILATNQKFGNLDWRLSQTHAIYWGMRGLDVATDHKEIACERMIFQGLASAFKGGRLIFLKDIQTLETTPNLDLLESTNQAYLDAKGAKDEFNIGVVSGYENFLIDAVVVLYTFGQRSKALSYLDKGRKMFPGRDFDRPLDDFALLKLADDMTSANYNQAQGTIQGYLIQTCYSLALGDEDRAAVFEMVSRKLWLRYMNEIGRKTVERRGLPPYADMKKNAVEQALKMFSPGLAQRLRNALPRLPDEKTETATQPQP